MINFQKSKVEQGSNKPFPTRYIGMQFEGTHDLGKQNLIKLIGGKNASKTKCIFYPKNKGQLASSI
jgi:hypothetical protein